MKLGAKHDFPTLKQLELLLALVQSDGISSAGAKLGLSPSATSHALRALESALGASLIDRSAPGAPLTYSGEQILPLVKEVFSSLQLMKSIARSDAQLKTGQLLIGSFGASGTLKALPPLLKAFHNKHPGVDVHVIEKPEEQTSLDLMEHRIELAVVPLPKLELETQTLAMDELVAILPEGHVLAQNDVVQLTELMEYPFLLTRAGSKPLIYRLLLKHDIKPRIAHELHQITSIQQYVAEGYGVSILARLALPEAMSGVVYRQLTPTTQRYIALACQNSNRLSPVARAFWDEAAAHRV
ncbi:LysR family transcriptional regulator [Comamonas thiooxydans]|uniref:LysR family transcriptional regulator n=1 Tax=Comamonas thiooxydans TaxID=363952 RepID=UPI0020CC0AD9|nr:LysR family transcriptional regulator [Comamonas thiooxydans]BDR10515.1 LysR family transcriptional regulator [Comamonas thiooxydans]